MTVTSPATTQEPGAGSWLPVHRGESWESKQKPKAKAFILRKVLFAVQREPPCTFISCRITICPSPSFVCIHSKINSETAAPPAGQWFPASRPQAPVSHGLTPSDPSDSPASWDALSAKSSPGRWNLLDCTSYVYLMVTLNSAISHSKSFSTRACSGVSTSPSSHTSDRPSCLVCGSMGGGGGACFRAPTPPPGVQGHGESCFASSSGEVYFPVSPEPLSPRPAVGEKETDVTPEPLADLTQGVFVLVRWPSYQGSHHPLCFCHRTSGYVARNSGYPSAGWIPGDQPRRR